MNIYRPQKPYQFRPPKYSALLAPFLLKVSEIFYLRRRFRLRKITETGLDAISQLSAQGHTILVAPNHADHADPPVLVYLAKQRRLAFHFMAAREGFEVSPLHAFVLQRCGAFSVDREGSDVNAIKTAMRILREARHPLVVFPEGEIYHHQERLDPLNEGVGRILLRAAQKLPEGKRAYLVPAAMVYTYDKTVETSFSDRISVLEQSITWKPREDMDTVERIYRFGGGLLAIKEIEFFGEAQSGNFVERLSALRNRLVARVEERHLTKAGVGSIPERVKTLRGKIRKQLNDPKATISDEEKISLYDDLDTLFVTVQLYSYPGQYLRKDYNIDRIAETILKLEEDVIGHAKYPAPRNVHVNFGNPIDVKEFLTEKSMNIRNAVNPLTKLLSERIQGML